MAKSNGNGRLIYGIIQGLVVLLLVGAIGGTMVMWGDVGVLDSRVQFHTEAIGAAAAEQTALQKSVTRLEVNVENIQEDMREVKADVKVILQAVKGPN